MNVFRDAEVSLRQDLQASSGHIIANLTAQFAASQQDLALATQQRDDAINAQACTERTMQELRLRSSDNQGQLHTLTASIAALTAERDAAQADNQQLDQQLHHAEVCPCLRSTISLYGQSMCAA